MNVKMLPATHVASKIMLAIKNASEAGTIIQHIGLTEAEFEELLALETVKTTNSKWYGSNESGIILNDIETRVQGDSTFVVKAYFNGIKLVRV